ncbi:branched-chain amino acid transport system II carrier protein [Mesobacillus maritimus]|uniref:branched-chain amino acid transport system II carrier protein n=1 Tax=Mesobacillus maritimus TaxID=1643336 RepID=UPI00203FFBFC|nr:branched-chain amino acid transport system II carrier protein [Mesobacillus maritimus]MCM3584757.1 branched-chain amino acid transport system II carrier protein [Mesobacillus maritimus]MCM3671877.1 branched-chain amino acid transport system II carrier protein [Mesobacillus maritimus]
MQQKIPFSTYAIIGTMLFGMFFGAGNLIFPIQMGQLAGTNYWPALIGFLTTAIGLPFIGILAFGLSGSSGLRDLAGRVHPLFGVVFAVALYLTIGPFFAIPRTATVPFVVGFEPYINPSQGSFYLGLFSFIFFAIVYYFSLNPAKIIDYIGKYLTPAFLVFLFLLIVIAIVKPMGPFDQPTGDYQNLAFITGFKEGYNTMDALASLAFGIVVIHAIKGQGITDTKEIAKATWKSGIFAMLLMMLIYGLITYMGASSISAIGSYENGGLIFAAVAQHYFGSFGSILLAIIIVLACLKTSIGLITACSEFFHQLLPKISYKWFVLILCLLSFTIANFGLNNIIQYAVPVLMLLYPLAIVLILLTLCSPLFNHKQSVYASAMFFTFCVSFFDGYSTLVDSLPGATLSWFETIKMFYMHYLPLYEIGLGWILPALVGVVLGLLWPTYSKKIAAASR